MTVVSEFLAFVYCSPSILRNIYAFICMLHVDSQEINTETKKELSLDVRSRERNSYIVTEILRNAVRG